MEILGVILCILIIGFAIGAFICSNDKKSTLIL